MSDLLQDGDSQYRRAPGRMPGLQSCLAVVSVALAMLFALGAGDARAEGTPTPERPNRIFLPVIVFQATPPPPVTVTFQQGIAGYSGNTATYITSYDAYAPHGSEPVLYVRWDRGHLTDAEAGLARFDLTSIPATATIQSATLSLYVTGHTNVFPINVAIFGVLRPWLPAQANWYSATLASPWALPGCGAANVDRLPLSSSTAQAPGIGIWVDFSIPDLVQSWVSAPGANYGMALKPTGTSSDASVRYELASPLHADAGLHPRLSVTYVLMPQAPPTPIPATATPTASPTPVAPTATATSTATPTPTWTPSASWWNTGYTNRRRLTVQAQADSVAAGYAVSLALDTSSLAAAGKLRADLRDWRIIAWNGVTWTELDRDIHGVADSWFSLQRSIAAGNSDDLYYVYYNSPDENSSALADKEDIYTFYDDFDGYDSAKWPWPPPGGIEVGGGVVTVTASNASGGPADSCPGAYDCMLSRQSFGLGYQVEERARHPDYVYLKQHDADQGFSDDGHTNEAKLRSYNAGMFQRVNRDGTTNVVSQCCQAADTDWHIFRVARLDAQSLEFQIDNSAPDVSTTHLPLIPLPVHIRAYSGEPFESSRNVVDWIKVRPIVASEPVVTWGNEETATFGGPGSSAPGSTGFWSSE